MLRAAVCPFTARAMLIYATMPRRAADVLHTTLLILRLLMPLIFPFYAASGACAAVPGLTISCRMPLFFVTPR